MFTHCPTPSEVCSFYHHSTVHTVLTVGICQYLYSLTFITTTTTITIVITQKGVKKAMMKLLSRLCSGALV
jgi:hypothetical protein